MNKKLKFKFLGSILPFLVAAGNGDKENVYKKLYSTKVRFSKHYRFNDRDRGHQLREFNVHGEVVEAYSKRDALKRWMHRDLKNRKRRAG